MCNDEGVVLNDGVCALMKDETWYMNTTSTGATTVYEWLQWWLQSGVGRRCPPNQPDRCLFRLQLGGPLNRGRVLEKINRPKPLQ